MSARAEHKQPNDIAGALRPPGPPASPARAGKLGGRPLTMEERTEMRANPRKTTPVLIAALVLLAALPRPGRAAQANGLEIEGKVVDIETNRPIGNFVVQRVWADANDPARGFEIRGESWSSFNPSGSLNESLREKGTSLRIVAPGYIPHLIPEQPYDGRPGKREVTVRMRPGWPIKGRLLDASRKPVAGASLFLVGGQMMPPNITGRKAWHGLIRVPLEDHTFVKAVTDGDGRFVLKGAGGHESAIAVSAAGLDFWLHEPVPRLGQPCEIVLPAPGRLLIRYEIDGDEPEATVSISCGGSGASSKRERKVTNRGRLVLDDLAPGPYHLERQKALKVGDASRLVQVASMDLVVQSGKTSEFALVREAGTIVEGEVIGLDRLQLPAR